MSRCLPPLAACAAVLLAALPADAITGGTFDGSGHPNVGALISDHVYGDGTWAYCTGTLVAPSVVLTAAHCAGADGERVRVSFAASYEDGATTHPGTIHVDPLYGKSQSDPHDIAVVVLDAPVLGLTPAPLPRAHALDGLQLGTTLVAVGYGAHEVVKGRGGMKWLYDDQRRTSASSLEAVNPAWLRASMVAVRGDGGTCYGDSGGPNFLADGTLAATTITGDTPCVATNVIYRLDTDAARAFLGAFVALP